MLYKTVAILTNLVNIVSRMSVESLHYQYHTYEGRRIPYSRQAVSGVNYLCRSASIIFAGFSFPFFHSFVVVGDSFHLLI